MRALQVCDDLLQSQRKVQFLCGTARKWQRTLVMFPAAQAAADAQVRFALAAQSLEHARLSGLLTTFACANDSAMSSEPSTVA
jgi:DNA-binding transcriptional regulator/RsmH inhibitor MraZ